FRWRIPMVRFALVFIASLGLAACDQRRADAELAPAAAPAGVIEAPVAAAPEPAVGTPPESAQAFATAEMATFDFPWAMTFLPDGRLLVTEMGGALKLHDPAAGTTGTVSGVPEVEHVAQGGLGDV